MFLTLRVTVSTSKVPLKTKLVVVEKEDDFVLAATVMPFVNDICDDLMIVDVLACQDLAKLNASDGIDIDLANFAHLRAHDLPTYGTFLAIRCTRTAATPKAPMPLPNALAALMRGSQTSTRELSLPPRCIGDRYDMLIQNGLLGRLQEHLLGFQKHHVDSAQKLLHTVAAGLSYLLPFDDAISENKPRGILIARGVKLPPRLTTKGLGLKPRSFGKKAKPNEERLDQHKFEQHANKIAKALSDCQWTRLPTWKKTVGKEFLDDVLDLCKVLAKKHQDMKQSVADVQGAQNKETPLRTPASDTCIEYEERRATSEIKPVYHQLRNALAELDSDYLYKPIIVTDAMMNIDYRSTLAVRYHARKAYLLKLCLEAPLGVYIYNGGGPYPRMIQVWAIQPPVSAAQQAAVTTLANQNLNIFATRQMKREFTHKFLPAGMSPKLLRNVWQTLDCPFLPDRCENSEVDDRMLKWLSCNDVSVECFADHRVFNGADGHSFDLFWDEMNRYLKLEIGQGAHERRTASSSDITFASRVISVPVLIQRVKEVLHTEPDSEDPLIPSLETVYLQFTANNPFARVARRMTGRFAMVRKVQTRNLRKWHEDAHWCLVHHKYAKQMVVEIRDILALLGIHDVVIPAHLDDKCKIPLGAPDTPLASTARAHVGGGTRGVLAFKSQEVAAMDHDVHKQGSITPSVSLIGDVPADAADSWYAGAIHVNLRDSVFEGSDPMLHMANLLGYLRKRGLNQARIRQSAWTHRQEALKSELEMWLNRDEAEVILEMVDDSSTYDELRLDKLQAIATIEQELEADAALNEADVLERWHMPLLIWITADGGADHNIQHLAVLLSLIAFARCVRVAKLSALRGCPYQSYTLTAERAMSLLHLGIQHVALERGRMSEASESLVARCSSMNEIRVAAGQLGKRQVKLATTGHAKKGAKPAKASGSTGPAAPSASQSECGDDSDQQGSDDSESAQELEIELILDARMNARSGVQAAQGMQLIAIECSMPPNAIPQWNACN